jgi:hypothetical protein
MIIPTRTKKPGIPARHVSPALELKQQGFQHWNTLPGEHE